MHIPCFPHTLNLIVSDAMKSNKNVSDLKKRCKQIVTFFHQSVKATEKLNHVQNQLKLPKHKLTQEVDTRWNSTYYMFELNVEQHEAITTSLWLSAHNSFAFYLQILNYWEHQYPFCYLLKLLQERFQQIDMCLFFRLYHWQNFFST